MFRLPDLTHVVIVAGDSDHVPLAQRCKRLGRFVVGVGVAGSTAKSSPPRATSSTRTTPSGCRPPAAPPTKKADAATANGSSASRRRKSTEDPAGELLRRALRLEQERTDDEWVHLSAVKNLLKRMDPSFSEKALGHRSFSDFVKAHPTIADIDESTNIVTVRLHGQDDTASS
jgi:hypothetical protein